MLSKIQSEIRANKGQRNEFGKYNYRSMEDINQAVKPILAAHGLALVVYDELQLIGDRYYIKATASLVDADGKVVASSTGYAREEETKKGMDASQITGACSSYARKYAANGLFCIDDNKDSDATNTHGTDAKAPVVPVRHELAWFEEQLEDYAKVGKLKDGWIDLAAMGKVELTPQDFKIFEGLKDALKEKVAA